MTRGASKLPHASLRPRGAGEFAPASLRALGAGELPNPLIAGRGARLLAALLVALIAGVWGCSETIAPEPAGQVVMTCAAPYLMRGDSTEITVSLVCAPGSCADDAAALRYDWSASFGTLIGDGAAVTYVAPDTLGTATIRLAITDAGGCAHEGVLCLPVYRQFIILKADDFLYTTGHPTGFAPGWRLFLACIEDKGLKTSVGAIGERMFGGTSAYYRGLAALVSTGRIEFFNHGWNHAINATREDGSVYCEFRDTPYEYQHAHFLATQRLLRKEAGIVLRGFGAPGNAHDEVTRRVIDEAGDTAYWFFAAGPSQKTILRRVADIEDKRNLPDYDTFVATYKPGAEYIVYQLHPWFWDETLLAEFVRCVDDLIAMGVTFVLPGEYVAMVNAARTPGD